MNTTPFDRLEPRDGFRVIPLTKGEGEISLHVGLYAEGDIVEALSGIPTEASIQIWERQQPKLRDRGACERVSFLAQAFCRYFNTGGNWSEVTDLVARLRQAIPGGLTFQDYCYLDGYIDTDGNFTHIFVKPGTDKVVRWVEGSFIDTELTLDDLAREREESEAEEIDADVENQPPFDEITFSDPNTSSASQSDGETGGVVSGDGEEDRYCQA